MIAVLQLLAVLVSAGAIVLMAAALVMALTVLRPPRMTDGKAMYVLRRLSPGDLNLTFEDVKFTVRDGSRSGSATIDLAAWWIPHPADGGKCVVFLHGYADAKVGSIAWAPVWHRLGYHILAIDLRAHGESGGKNCTAGFFERNDLNEAINRLRTDRPRQTQKIVLFGVSMGGAAALATAAIRDDIAAVVLDSPFADYSDAVAAHGGRLGFPGGAAFWLAMWMARRISGADFHQVRPVSLLARVKCPVMLIWGENEDFLPAVDLELLQGAMSRRANAADDAIWIVPGARHLTALQEGPDAYASRLGDFLKKLEDARP